MHQLSSLQDLSFDHGHRGLENLALKIVYAIGQCPRSLLLSMANESVAVHDRAIEPELFLT